mgnify:CR=1 FL=1
MTMMEILKIGRVEHRRGIADRAREDLKNHRLELIGRSEDSIARWKCARDGSWVYGFNVVMWPGAVVINGSDYGRLMYELFGDAEGGCSDFDFRPLYLCACLKRFMELHDAALLAGKLP